MIFNINDEVIVGLTKEGEKIWLEYWTKYGGDYVPDLQNGPRFLLNFGE